MPVASVSTVPPPETLGLDEDHPHPPYVRVIGPLLVGTCLGAFFCGFLVQQSVIYWVRFRFDPLFYKACVLLLTILSVISFCGNIGQLWHDAIETRLNDAALLESTSLGVLSTATPVFSCAINQAFFTARATRFTKSTVVGVLLGFLTFSCFVVGLSGVGLDVKNRTDQNRDILTIHMVEAWLWMSAGTDVLLSAVLTWRLSKDHNGFNSRTNSILRRLLILSVSTAGITSLVAIIDGVLLVAIPSSGSAEVSFARILLVHLYGLTCVGTLNLRSKIGLALGTSGGRETRKGGESSGGLQGVMTDASMSISAEPDLENQHNKISQPQYIYHESDDSKLEGGDLERWHEADSVDQSRRERGGRNPVHYPVFDLSLEHAA